MKQCAICTSDFNPVKRTQICCCKACSYERQLIVQRWKSKRKKMVAESEVLRKKQEKVLADEKARKEAKICGIPVELYLNLSPLGRASRLAKANGLSYGEYMARCQ